MIQTDQLYQLLRPHQRQSVQHLLSVLKSYDSACDLSDTGTGKTFVACAVAAILQLPTLAIVPKISITVWNQTAEMFGEKISVVNPELLSGGRTPYGVWSNAETIGQKRPTTFVCSICFRTVDFEEKFYYGCPHHRAGIHCVTIKKGKLKRGKFTFHPGVKFLIVDEVHRFGGLKSLNADILIAAKQQKIKTLLLSATLASSPLQLRAAGYCLDLHSG